MKLLCLKMLKFIIKGEITDHINVLYKYYKPIILFFSLSLPPSKQGK